ncbi:aspartic peptidase domain-containing protein [Gymnopilus junonius]|uniref:Aspartic peptidase domain-containing protein n=1 Tax=Gymnopilus junonius TaxID=109634 RepID=A0A9P5TGT0_GYMJU|nr:aspartic peptidase domain-containing protein [Gymnopilus junonius]
MLSNISNVACLISLASQFSWSPVTTSRWCYEEPQKIPASYDTPTNRDGSAQLGKERKISGSIGLGNYLDLMYTVPIKLGETMIPLHLDTGSSDLWVVSDKCTENACQGAQVTRYPNDSFLSAEIDLDLYYGDSTTGTYASGLVGLETVSVAGVTMAKQPFALIDDTNNHIVGFNAAGIFGLSFPSASRIQEELAVKTGPLVHTDHFLQTTDANAPLLSRLAMSGALESPMFTIQLQRGALDISGHGALTIGRLPDGIDNSSLTWVPVRRYAAEEGGLPSSSFAPQEVYPYRWEVDIDGVYLDGERLADSAIPAHDVDSNRLSALIDTGNSVLRGPADVVTNILSLVSSSYDPQAFNPVASLPCNMSRSLAFKIGGKMFPIDPRDFISQLEANNTHTCQADNIVPTDSPTIGSLYRWSLGTPLFRSNIVAFYYGNLTHPSQDPPRIGFLSTVPDNADKLIQDAIRNATLNGGNFPYAVQPAPTELAAVQPHTVVSPAGEYIPDPQSPPNHTSQDTQSSAILVAIKKSNAGFLNSWKPMLTLLLESIILLVCRL